MPSLVFQGIRSRVCLLALHIYYGTTTPPLRLSGTRCQIIYSSPPGYRMALRSARSFSISSIWTCNVAFSASCQSSAAPAWDRDSSLASTSANNPLRLLYLLMRDMRASRRLLAFLLTSWKALHSEQFFRLHRPCLLLHTGFLFGSLTQGQAGSFLNGFTCHWHLARPVVWREAMLFV